jgi:hypothetical protein
METAMTVHWTDRRQSERWTHPDDHGIVSIRVRSGYAAVIVNMSAGGALIETASRLLPGAPVDLHIEAKQRRTTWRGHVLRCTVGTLRATSVSYCAAIVFDRALPWFANMPSNGYLVPAENPEESGLIGVGSTHNEA